MENLNKLLETIIELEKNTKDAILGLNTNFDNPIISFYNFADTIQDNIKNEISSSINRGEILSADLYNLFIKHLEKSMKSEDYDTFDNSDDFLTLKRILDLDMYQELPILSEVQANADYLLPVYVEMLKIIVYGYCNNYNSFSYDKIAEFLDFLDRYKYIKNVELQKQLKDDIYKMQNDFSDYVANMYLALLLNESQCYDIEDFSDVLKKLILLTPKNPKVLQLKICVQSVMIRNLWDEVDENEPPDFENVRPICEIAKDIKKYCPNINEYATPYLEAMMYLNNVNDTYGNDSASSIISYFLANFQYLTQKERGFKKELQNLLKIKEYNDSQNSNEDF